MVDSKPYISLVVTARNDDHGGYLLNRVQIFVDGLAEQARRHRIPLELILVEWNPVPNKPPLYKVVAWPIGPSTMRAIVIPRRIHKRLRNSARLPLFQMIAKNVGIRRARGTFILATNIDLLFSDELAGFFAARKLDPGRFYRIDRYDVAGGVPKQESLDEQLQYCRENVIRVNTKDGTIPISLFRWPRTLRILIGGIGLARDFIRTLMPGVPTGKSVKSLKRALARFLRKIKRRSTAGRVKLLTKTAMNLVEDFAKRRLNLLKRVGRVVWRVLKPPYPSLHTNGCGDFTLMSAEKWRELRGYPEMQMFSFNVDSVLLHMAYQLGLREEVLDGKMRLYHIEHSGGWTPERERDMYARLRRLGVPYLSYRKYESLAKKMSKQRRPVILNDENWGFASEQLEEIKLN